jgi:DNA-binding NtrC family response regulator
MELIRVETVPMAPHILIAEDQPAIQELLRWTVHLAGYRATVCGGRQAALAWRDQPVVSEDASVVLLLDVSLLCTKAVVDFLRHVRAHWQDADVLPQIIVLTTDTQVQADLGQKERVLQKPFHIRDLITLIQQALLSPLNQERSAYQTNEEEQGNLF